MERIATLRLDSRCLELLLRASQDAAPEEACGLLAGRRLGAEVHVCDVPSARNVAPHPELEFEVDPGEVVALHDAAARNGAEIVGTWHSHVRGVAAPSRTDLDDAWPGHVLVIAAGESVRAFVVERDHPRELAVSTNEARDPAARDGATAGG